MAIARTMLDLFHDEITTAFSSVIHKVERRLEKRGLAARIEVASIKPVQDGPDSYTCLGRWKARGKYVGIRILILLSAPSDTAPQMKRALVARELALLAGNGEGMIRAGLDGGVWQATDEDVSKVADFTVAALLTRGPVRCRANLTLAEASDTLREVGLSIGEDELTPLAQEIEVARRTVYPSPWLSVNRRESIRHEVGRLDAELRIRTAGRAPVRRPVVWLDVSEGGVAVELDCQVLCEILRADWVDLQAPDAHDLSTLGFVHARFSTAGDGRLLVGFRFEEPPEADTVGGPPDSPPE